MPYGIKEVWATQQSLAFGSIGAAYTQVGTFTHPARQVIISNLTDANLQFAVGPAGQAAANVVDSFPLLTNSQFINDISSNRVQQYPFFAGQGDALYVKRIGTPTTGSVYLSYAYGKGD